MHLPISTFLLLNEMGENKAKERRCFEGMLLI